MPAKILVNFYKIWHGALHLKGAGWLLQNVARWSKGLREFSQPVPELGVAVLDFRDVSAFAWLHYLAGKRGQEDALLAILKQYVTSDSVYWDVGANAGITMAHVVTNYRPAKAYAIEPNPAAVKVLTSLFGNLTNVYVINAALSDQNKLADLYIPLNDSCKASLERYQTMTGADRKSEVACYTGDYMIEERGISAPAILKIDVEGHELAVLRGLKRCIRRYSPVILFEHIFLSDKDIKQAIPEGYSLFTISDSDANLLPGLSRSAGHNCLLLPNKTTRQNTLAGA